jgi:hypothetical protein
MPLYTHQPHTHHPQNVNEQHQTEQAAAGFNTRLAVWLTRNVGTMATAYLFAAIGIGSLVGVFTGNTLLAVTCGALSSYFLQLVLLPIISVGTNVLGHKQELLADEQYQTTMHTFHDTEQMLRHLDAQDAELLRQTAMMAALLHHVAPDTSVPTVPAPPPRRRDAKTGRWMKRDAAA